MKTIIVTIASAALIGCAGEITPEQALAGAEAASAWLDVVAEAREILDEK